MRDFIVDIHTAEFPIEIIAHNAHITLSAAKLEDCTINGVLNVYAVRRWTLGSSECFNQGKAGIFKESEPWTHHIGQSERGISNLLSALRMFTELVSDENMEEERQGAVLCMIHLLTRSPPAVRAK